MFKIQIIKRVPPGLDKPGAEVEVPFLPRKGDYVAYDKHGLDGYVHEVAFWWNAEGVLNVQVVLA